MAEFDALSLVPVYFTCTASSKYIYSRAGEPACTRTRTRACVHALLCRPLRQRCAQSLPPLHRPLALELKPLAPS
eukprot:6191969-Pleurochrysis_carterae.AAC.4